MSRALKQLDPGDAHVALSYRGIIVGTLIAMLCVALTADRTIASNMGFKANKRIVLGTNLVALPWRSPTDTAQQLCAVFGKTTAQTNLTQFTGTSLQSYSCDQVTPGFPLIKKGHGVRIIETGSPANGIIVGSQLDGTVTLPDAGPFPIGTIIYAFPYHTTNATGRDICQNAGLTAVSPAPLLVRYGPGGVVDATYTCEQVGAAGYPLRLLEAVMISGEQNGPKTWVPSHY